MLGSAIWKASLRLCALVSAALMLALSIGPSTWATPVKEAPWRPEAAAYRTTLFLGNLTPIPWERIAAVWTEPYPGALSDIAAFDALSASPERDAIRLAIDAQDRAALFAASTRAIADALAQALDRAGQDLGSANAQLEIAKARELYRAFADGIDASDPEAARRLGLAWLKLSSSAGSRGVLKAGRVEAQRDGFLSATSVIIGYVTANYAPESFADRRILSSIPESVVAAGGLTDVPPSLPPGSYIGDQSPLPLLVLNFEEQGIDETDLPLIAYGDMLFDSPEIFGDPARALGIACSTCHNRSDINRDFFIPGLSHRAGGVDVDSAFFNPIANDRRDDPLDIPSLRGLRFTGPYGRDGRMASLRDFTRNVIVGEFGGAEPTPFMLDALVGYMLEFDFLPNSKLTADGWLAEGASDAARRGEALFRRDFAEMGGRSCASCHDPSANFQDRKAHDIGSIAAAYEGSRAGALDTPTLLGAKFTAPYFHDGSLPTLASTVVWFDNRYGLGLTKAERDDLTAYLEAVGDADAPYESFGERNTPFRLAFEELTTFASTLDALIARRDARHALLMIDTVAADLAADASTMANLSAKPGIYTLSRQLRSIGDAIRADDWGQAAAFWAAFQAHQAAIDESVY